MGLSLKYVELPNLSPPILPRVRQEKIKRSSNNFLYIALSAAAELETKIIISNNLKYIDDEKTTILLKYLN